CLQRVFVFLRSKVACWIVVVNPRNDSVASRKYLSRFEFAAVFQLGVVACRGELLAKQAKTEVGLLKTLPSLSKRFFPRQQVMRGYAGRRTLGGHY
ncbi:MAG: hypothetical protein ACI9HX_000769, partial [Pseudoalteromonas tetraodonis]